MFTNLYLCLIFAIKLTGQFNTVLLYFESD